MPLNSLARQCKATTRDGTRCENPAVTGYNVCRMHGAGGGRPIVHGRYSKLKHVQMRELIDQFEADPDPLNIFPELAASRALFNDFIERYNQFKESLLAWNASRGEGERPTKIMDVSDAASLLEQVTRIAERIERAEAQNAISRRELMRVMSEMSRIVQAYVADPDTLQKIKDGWLGIRIF